MKLLKTILITSLALLLTGCYTQLEYSQTMKKVTDEKPSKEAGVYAWNGEEKEEKEAQKQEQAVDEQYVEYENEGEEYIPIYYKDYEYATKYGDVYNVNNYFGNDWYGYSSYYPYSSFRSYYAWNPFYYDRWSYHSFFGYGYHRPAFGVSFSIGWGRGYYRGFYDPFFDPYFDYYWYRYHSPFAYNYRSFYGKSGYGYGYYSDKKVRQDKNTRYGPRSIGTNRVAADGNRSRSVNGRSASVSNESSGVRTRSTGTLRTRSSEKGSTSVTRTKRDTNSSSSSTRVRTRTTDTSNRSGNRDAIKRSRENTAPIVIDKNQLKQLRSRSSSANEGLINRSRLNNNERKKTPTFFNRMKNFLQDGTSRVSNGNSTRTIRSRSTAPSSSRSKINRKSSSNRSSVTKSKSSSSNSRSRGSSSSSRNRSGGSSSSDSDRSRGN